MSTLASAPPPQTRTARATAGVLAFAGGVMMLLPLPVILLSVGKFREVFADFGVALPMLTRGFIELGRFATSGFGIAILFAFSVAVILMSLASARFRAAAIAWFILALAYMGVVLIAYACSMFIPLAAMIDGLKGSV